MLVREMIKRGETQLNRAHCTDAGIDAERLYCYLQNVDKVKVFLQANDPVEEATREAYFNLIEERAKRIPLQYITGTQEFMGFPFAVNEDVLIPRQDTEVLAEQAAKIIGGEGTGVRSRRKWNVLDLCCGSGNVGISLAKICANAKVTAADLSGKAVETAKKNAAANRVKLTFLQGNLFEPVKKKRYDMIVSNPPYIPTHMIPILQDEIKAHEPLMALDGGEDGLDFYRKIIDRAPVHLSRQGVLILEIGQDQAEEVTRLIRDTMTFSKVHVVKDLPGNNRVVYAAAL